jgi:large subunit ribosomal protein L31
LGPGDGISRSRNSGDRPDVYAGEHFAGESPAADQRGTALTNHPTLHLAEVRCATCGTSFTTRSTVEVMAVDVCSNCHPAYTGQARVVAAGNRVERFNRRRALAAA